MKPIFYNTADMENYFATGLWNNDDAGDLWEKWARLCPDKEALVDDHYRLTWAEADRLTNRLALGFLEMGFQHDHVIVAQLPNCTESVLIRRACQKAGLLFSPPPVTLRHREMEHILKLFKAKDIVIPWKFGGFDYYQMIMEIKPNLPDLERIYVIGEEVPPGAISIQTMMEKPLEKKYPADYLKKFRFSPGEVDLVPVTSGTTGLPKISSYLMCGLLGLGRLLIDRWKITSDDIIMAILNNHLGGALAECWGVAPYTGSKVVLLERFDPEHALRLIEKEKVTVATAVPAQIIMILRHPNFEKYDLSSLRLFHYGGAPLAYPVALEIEERMKCTLVGEYGSMDKGDFTSAPVDAPREKRFLTVGKIYPGATAKLLDEQGREVPLVGEIGELVLKGPTQFGTGYYNDPEATRTTFSEDGFARTGDLVKIDEEGFVTVVGRRSDMILRGGQNIYPVEIENLLLMHPKVYNVVIVPMPDPVLGERACAYVIPKENQTVTLEELNSFLLDKKLAKYKLPERLEVRDSFPLLSDGAKIDKKALAAEIAKKVAT